MERFLRVLRTSKRTIEDFKKILDSDVPRVISACVEFPKKFDSVGDETLTAIGLRMYFSTYVDSEVSARLVSQLMGLVKFSEETLFDRREFSVLLKGLFNATDLSSEQMQRWELLYPVIAELLNEEDLHLIFKASQLYFETDGGIDGIRILTEVRPVFNKKADFVVGYIIRNVLRITDGSEQESEFTLSIADLDKFLQEIERARNKTATIKKELSEVRPRKIAIYGDKYDQR